MMTALSVTLAVALVCALWRIWVLDAAVTMAADSINRWAQAATNKDFEIANLRAQIAKFDHDGDGKPGGSKKKR